jgi:hypothetical protein
MNYYQSVTKPAPVSWASKVKTFRPETIENTHRSLKTDVSSNALLENGGVILIQEHCTNHKGRCEPAIILFVCARSHVVSDGGGKKSPEDLTVEDTARRELLEESCNLIDIHASVLEISPKYKWSNYTCYFVNIDENILPKIYVENRKALRINRAPKEWTETKGIRKFYISDLRISLGSQDDIRDINNVPFRLRPRTRVAIYEGLLKNTVEYPQLQIELLGRVLPECTFTQNTQTYHITV